MNNEIENTIKELRGGCIDCSEYRTTDNKCHGLYYCPNRAAADLIERLSAENEELKKKAINWDPVTERFPEDPAPNYNYGSKSYLCSIGNITLELNWCKTQVRKKLFLGGNVEDLYIHKTAF